MLFEVERFDEFEPEHVRMIRLQEKRTVILATLARELQSAVDALWRHRTVVHRSNFRIADFAQFALKATSASRDELEHTRTALERLTERQRAFAVADNPILNALDRYLTTGS